MDWEIMLRYIVLVQIVRKWTTVPYRPTNVFDRDTYMIGYIFCRRRPKTVSVNLYECVLSINQSIKIFNKQWSDCNWKYTYELHE